MITCKRVYDDKDGKHEGYRVLVDRLWPRGVKKSDFHYDEWNKALAPSTELRKWFHENGDFTQFTARYIKRIRSNTGKLATTIEGSQRKTISITVFR